MSYRTEALKELFLLYQSFGDDLSMAVDSLGGGPNIINKEDVFAGMLKRANDLLLWVIYKHRKIKPHLGQIKLADLYQTAIVGLGRAALTAKESESADEVVARIIAYVKSELSSTYPLTKTRRDFAFQHLEVTAEKYILKDRDVQGVEEIELDAQLALLRGDYVKLLVEGVVSELDFSMFVYYYGHSISYVDIGKVVGMATTTVQRHVKLTREKVQKYFEGWDI